ncbi:MAG TPA: CoA ester lyase [Quisquiliibacterium sp.]|nr:CoA ester lyase [Quisquiliibacterium sp.]
MGIVRSYLFAPGSRPERFAKALEAGADAVILDLEDAVGLADKAAARDAIAGWLSPRHPVLVRINGSDTPWFEDDLAVCALPGVSGVVLPKAERPEQVAAVVARVGAAVPVLPLIETAAGIWNAHAVAIAPRVQRLLFGSIDFQVDLGIDGEGEELLHFRSQLVLVSRVAGLQSPVDGVCTAIDDPERISAEAHRARRLGFGAKLCIHPKQVGPVRDCWRPTQEQVDWARRVVAADAASGGAAVALDGKMVDRPVLLKAREILAGAGAGDAAGTASQADRAKAT